MTNDPGDPRSRLPQQISIGGGWAIVYAILAVAFAGGAIYYITVRQAPLTSPQVAVTGLGALWFSLRAAMSFRPNRNP
jgi:hypothetical protein